MVGLIAGLGGMALLGIIVSRKKHAMLEEARVPLPCPPSPFKIGIYYVWHDLADYDPGWRDNIKPGLEKGLNRFSQYMETDVVYTFLGEHRAALTNIGLGQHLTRLRLEDADTVLDELCESLAFPENYRYYDCMFLVFANSIDAFVVNYSSPVYFSDFPFFVEEIYGRCLVEHELFHLFGLSGPTCTPGELCIMKDPMLEELVLCSYCQTNAKWENYAKTRLELSKLLV